MGIPELIIKSANEISNQFTGEGKHAPLDCDEVDAISIFFKARLNFMQGNMTQGEYDKSVEEFNPWFYHVGTMK